ncbi:unnamed protein product [Didymodactylos carnosus]|uniref:Uncharacterized protein n=1 Tax=Didymodactylos carnosus TaxID=1234261 RepID=A0A815FQ11_9BILA|nr:unnamed protein product [Didymodactylos carnosus]CAF1330373.1 unnamed protein product [Didymodactylos carnosus]CAF4042754.1 unnamed protein product [Didymodactylos carnosus]CAF4183332.1 unnamed protein product [Didymodactylos carnosus]
MPTVARGTGKSNILSKLAKKLGIVMVGPPLAAGELNRSLVGESERILIALCSPCNHVPSCYQNHPDVIKIRVKANATNQLYMMDEAFLGRLSGKFFVGRPSSNARMTLLRKIPFWMVEPELLGRLSIVTKNFCGAAVTALNRDITTHCIEMKLTNPIGEIEALKLADTTAQNHQIFIGSETLSRLLLRNLLTSSRPRIYQLSKKYKYSGRMIVDLHNKYIRTEVLQSTINTEELSILEYALEPNETNVQTLLERLTACEKSRNAQLPQLIDLNLLASKSAHGEKQVYETLKDRYDECAAYTRSMIIYDLDALIGITKSECDSNTGCSMSYSIHNQGIYTYVLARFRDRIMVDIQMKKLIMSNDGQ